MAVKQINKIIVNSLKDFEITRFTKAFLCTQSYVYITSILDNVKKPKINDDTRKLSRASM